MGENMKSEKGYILRLPPETVLLIFGSFSNLNEPLRLALTCQHLYIIFKSCEDSIAWSIIRSSRYHIYDAPLCYLADAMHDQDEDLTFAYPSLSNCFLDYDPLFSATAQSIKTSNVYLRRIRLWWKQANELRRNFILNMNEYRHALSYHSIEDLPWEEREKYKLACYADCGYQIGAQAFPLSKRAESETISQGRFYRAIMARTLDTKTLQLHALFPDSNEPDDVADCLYEKILKSWCQNSARSLQESLENLEIFDYTSNFLLLRAFNSPEGYLDWADDAQKSEIVDAGDTILDNWMSFHLRLQAFLTPFDILSLITPGAENENEREKLSRYVMKFLSLSAVDAYDILPGMTHLEKDVSFKLSQAASKAWKHFRSHRWRSVARGRIFNEGFDINNEITEYRQGRRLWWKYLNKVEIYSMQTSISIRVPRFWFVPFEDLTLPGEEPDPLSLDDYYVLEHPPRELLT